MKRTPKDLWAMLTHAAPKHPFLVLLCLRATVKQNKYTRATNQLLLLMAKPLSIQMQGRPGHTPIATIDDLRAIAPEFGRAVASYLESQPCPT